MSHIVNAHWFPAFLPFLVAAAVTALTVPLTMALAHRVGAVADPDPDRHIHPHPTPRLGGIALYAGFAVAVAVFGAQVSTRWTVVAVTGAITVAMAVDDILDLPWWTKLVIEVGAGVAVAVGGILITYVALPGPHGASIIDLGLLATPLTVLWMTGMQVSINILDGSDGVAAGVVAIVAGVLLLAAINRLGAQGGVQAGVIVLSGALMGCCTGFLLWNTHPARTFMGDAGSHFLGVAVGAMTVMGVAKVAVALALAVPLLALALPIVDTLFAIVRRKRAGTGIARPDAGHLHHRLLASGLSPRETAITFYLCTAVLGCLGLALFGHRKIVVVGVVLCATGLAALVWRFRRRAAAVTEEAMVTLRGRATLREPAAQREGDAD